MSLSSTVIVAAFGAVAETMLSKNMCKVAEQAFKFYLKQKAAGGAAQGASEEIAELLRGLNLEQHLEALCKQVDTVEELANMTDSDAKMIAEITGIRYLVLQQMVEAARAVVAAEGSEKGEEEEGAEGDDEGVHDAADDA
jgi:hypothetical protein